LHSNTAVTDDIRRSSIDDLEISQYHKEAELLLAEDRFYCEQSLHKLLNGSQSTKRRWLHRVKLSRARKVHQDNIQPRITQFFPTHNNRSKPDTIRPRPNRRPMSLSASRPTTTQEPPTRFPGVHNPNPPVSAKRTVTTQQLLTKFLKERAPNQTISQSPSPLRPAIS